MTDLKHLIPTLEECEAVEALMARAFKGPVPDDAPEMVAVLRFREVEQTRHTFMKGGAQ